jgi:hypothetical protein
MTDADQPVEATADDRPTITLAGEQFPVADKVSLMALMRFAYVASRGVTTNDLDGLSALYEYLRSVVADDAWEAFQHHASVKRVDGDELFAVAQEAIKLTSERPTKRPSDSSDGPSATEPSSSDTSPQSASSTPPRGTASPLLSDPRVQELRPLELVARQMLTG